MRALLTLGLAGCTAGGAVSNLPTDTDSACDATAGPEYVEASSATLSFNNLLINGATVGTDITNIQACVRADGNGAAWLIDDSNGSPLMMILNESTSTGSLAMTDGRFLVDVYGNSPPIQFEGTDWYTNQWMVSGLSPFSSSFTGAASDAASNQMNLSYFATANP